MSKLFIPAEQNARNSFGLLAVRVIAGIALLIHGWPKIQAPMSWIEGVQSGGREVPGLLVTLAPVAAIGEFLGGILLALGLMTPVSALLVMGTMAGAVLYHWQNGDPFVSLTGGFDYELPALYFVVAFLVLLTGPGGFSLDKMLFKRQRH